MKKIGLLIMSLVLALGALGVGYAAWAKTINVYGSVNTGYTSAEFSSSDIYTQNFNNDIVVSLAPEADTTWLDVTVNNAYPGSLVTNVPFTIHNNGTVPIKVTDMVLSDPDSVLEWSSFVAPTDASIGTDAYSGNGYLSFKVNSDPNTIAETTTYHFQVAVNYTVAPGD